MAGDYSIDVVRRTPALLGESPVWSQRERALYWVDIHGCRVHRFDPSSGSDTHWQLAENVGSLGLRRSGGAVVALRSGFHLFDFATGATTPIANPIAGTRDLRFNDGRCDRQGRFWSGTVNEKREPGTATIYRLDAKLECTPMVEGITVANTIAWSPEGTRMYFGCSWQRVIFACDFDRDAGTLGDRRVFASFGPGEGAPDGATTDEDGCLWVAHHDGGRITRFRPDGNVDRVIPMPVPRPSSCSFGGVGYDTLYVTSVSSGLDPRVLHEAPLSGALFALDVGVRGVPEPLFAG
jgi:L-arabinonolactonase